MKLGCYKPLALLLAGLTFQLAGCARVSEFVAQKAPTTGNSVAAQMNIGRLHEQQGRLDKARDVYLEVYAKTRGEQRAKASHRLGIVCGQLGEVDSAKAHFQEALAGSTRKSSILNDLGYLLYLQNELDEARYILEQAAAQNPNDDRIANNLALVLGKQGNIDESFALFRQTIGEAEANANIGFLHAMRGEGHHATARYSRALSLDGDLKSAANALGQIADIKSRLDNKKAAEQANPFEDTMLAGAQPEDDPEILPAVAVTRDSSRSVEQAHAEQFDTFAETADFAPEPEVPTDPQQIIKAICDLQGRPVEPTAISRELTPYLNHEDKHVRLYAARGLLWIGQQTEAAVSGLLDGLSDPQSDVRATAASFLQDLNPKPKAVLESLQASLYDSDPFVRLYAANSIGASDVTASIATAILTHPDARARWLATLALVDFAPKRVDTVLALTAALGDVDSRTRAGAAAALGSIGLHAESALPRLNEATTDSDPAVRQAAFDAIEQIQSL